MRVFVDTTVPMRIALIRATVALSTLNEERSERSDWICKLVNPWTEDECPKEDKPPPPEEGSPFPETTDVEECGSSGE